MVGCRGDNEMNSACMKAAVVSCVVQSPIYLRDWVGRNHEVPCQFRRFQDRSEMRTSRKTSNADHSNKTLSTKILFHSPIFINLLVIRYWMRNFAFFQSACLYSTPFYWRDYLTSTCTMLRHPIHLDGWTAHSYLQVYHDHCYIFLTLWPVFILQVDEF